MIQIRNRYTGKIIYEAECRSVKACVELAVKNNGVNQKSAKMEGVNLEGARNVPDKYLKTGV